MNCDDGFACTTDSCSGGTCSHTPNNSACDNGLFCDGVETCSANTGCQDGSDPPLLDAFDCTDDTCNEDDDRIDHIPNNAACDDGEPCTMDGCDVGGCVHAVTTDPTDLCDDENACTVNDHCVANVTTPTCTGDPKGCENDDGCCSADCNANNDNDCSAVCGNSVVETGETCDEGAANNDTAPVGFCRTDCTRCGDGIVQTSEECDYASPPDGGPLDESCDQACEIVSFCSDGSPAHEDILVVGYDEYPSPLAKIIGYELATNAKIIEVTGLSGPLVLTGSESEIFYNDATDKIYQLDTLTGILATNPNSFANLLDLEFFEVPPGNLFYLDKAILGSIEDGGDATTRLEAEDIFDLLGAERYVQFMGLANIENKFYITAVVVKNNPLLNESVLIESKIDAIEVINDFPLRTADGDIHLGEALTAHENMVYFSGGNLVYAFNSSSLEVLGPLASASSSIHALIIVENTGELYAGTDTGVENIALASLDPLETKGMTPLNEFGKSRVSSLGFVHTSCMVAMCIPKAEVCDGMDNNCDGVIDDGPDENHDGVMDACEPHDKGECKDLNLEDDLLPTVDTDNDGHMDACDNCPDDSNKEQIDDDEDGFGNTCDNCPYKANDQADADDDGDGDICDPEHEDFCPTCCCTGEGCPDQNSCFDGGDEDSDGDAIDDECDNCVDDPNHSQNDVDEDEIGNVCDNCPEDPNNNQLDTDGDGVGDVCDNCVELINPDQLDTDNDGIGDLCEEEGNLQIAPCTGAPGENPMTVDEIAKLFGLTVNDVLRLQEGLPVLDTEDHPLNMSILGVVKNENICIEAPAGVEFGGSGLFAACNCTLVDHSPLDFRKIAELVFLMLCFLAVWYTMRKEYVNKK